MFVKLSKCLFAKREVEYLGHVISRERVSIDPKKILAMTEWPRPTTIKELSGFLGLIRYYRRFTQHYGIICKPLIELLNKDKFQWNTKVEAAFLTLKKAITQALVLALPNFSKTFVVETDACDVGVGAVLMREGRPLVYISQTLSPKHLGLSVYDKELLVVLVAIDKWRHYLESSHFIIKTDHESLRFLLQQRLHTQLQRKGASKLLGLDYTIKYRQGRENRVVDALSRREGEGSCYAITTIIPDWVKEIIESYEHIDWLKEL